MENIAALVFLLVIQCLITSDLVCKGETLQGDCLKSDLEALLDLKNGLKGSSTRHSS